MTYVVLEECIGCKYTDCVEPCPVDAFHEGEEMLYINPDVCIDCDVCVPACPADAIKSEKSLEKHEERMLAVNREGAARTPIINEKISERCSQNDF